MPNDKQKLFALIVIDMAQEQLYPVDFTPESDNQKKISSNILKLASIFPAEKVFDSRLWISEQDHSSLHKLYPDVGNAGKKGTELVTELREMKATFVKKIQYSAFYASQLHELLKAQEVNTILLTGINTDWCVFASALDAFYLGYEVWLIEDACESICSGREGHKRGIEEFSRFLGCMGKVYKTAEAILKIS